MAMRELCNKEVGRRKKEYGIGKKEKGNLVEAERKYMEGRREGIRREANRRRIEY
jgi:hypothetical protein